jgi:hypothetical protein
VGWDRDGASEGHYRHPTTGRAPCRRHGRSMVEGCRQGLPDSPRPCGGSGFGSSALSHARDRQLRLVCKVPAQPSAPSASVIKPSRGAGLGADVQTVRTIQPSAGKINRPHRLREIVKEVNGIPSNADDAGDADDCAGTLHTWGTRYDHRRSHRRGARCRRPDSRRTVPTCC